MPTAARLDPSSGLLRGLRAAVLTVPTVGTAALGHALVDGCDSVFAVLVAAGLCWPAAVALLGRQRRLGALLAWVLAAEAGLHVVFAALCGDGQGARQLLVGLSPAMVTAHVVAGLVTAGLLTRADAGLWAAQALLRALRRRPRPRPVSLVPPTPLRRTPPRRPAPVPAGDVLLLPTRRGPPVPAAVAS